MDFGGERVPINEPFFDDMVEMSPPVAEENKIKLVSDKLEVPLL